MARISDGRPPQCPFCGTVLEAPKELEPKRLGDFAYGACGCGAVYVCDVTGHNLGAALVEAMMLACGDDMDLMWSLTPEEDYGEARIEGYDLARNLVFPAGRNPEGDRVKGVITLIRLDPEVAEAVGERRRARFAAYGLDPKATREVDGPSYTPLPPRRYSKREVERRVRLWDEAGLVEMARSDPIILNKIQRLLYSPDPELRWQAVKAVGLASRVVQSIRPGQVGDLLRRLHFSATDSAAANWGAIESMGEIIRNNPRVYGTFVSQLFGLLRHAESRAAVLWALGRVAERSPELLKSSAFFTLFDLLESEEPEIRGLAAWVLGTMGARGAEGRLARMVEDGGTFPFFDGERCCTMTVGEAAREALRRLEEKEMEREREAKGEIEGQSGGQGDPQELERARSLYREGDLMLARGMSLDALEKLTEALSLFEGMGRTREVANTCDKLGDCHLIRGNFRDAIAMYQRALAICEKAGDSISGLIILDKITDVYKKEGRLESALPYYMHGLELAEELREAGRACLYLTAIGDIYQRQGRREDALDAYRLALKIAKGQGARERARILEEGIARLEAQPQAG